MTGLSEPAEHWFGLCRKPPSIHVQQQDSGITAVLVCESLQDGGSGGSDTIRRGIGSAFSAMRTLNRNRQLLWFTLLAGLVLAGNAVIRGALRYADRITPPGGIVETADGFFIPEFILAFVTLFCLVYLMASLALSIPSRTEGPASFTRGLGSAGKYLKTIALWSFVLALAFLLFDRVYVYLAIVRFPNELGLLYTLGDGFFISMIDQFPFNWTLDWNILTEIPGYGGRSLLLWIYPFGFLETLHFSIITLFIFALTPFVIPLIVIGQKNLRESVTGSFALMKKILAETAACILFLGAVITALFFTYLLVQAVSGIVSPYDTVTFHPPDAWVIFALAYDIALLVAGFIVATVGAIAILDLYDSLQNLSDAGDVI